MSIQSGRAVGYGLAAAAVGAASLCAFLIPADAPWALAPILLLAVALVARHMPGGPAVFACLAALVVLAVFARPGRPGYVELTGQVIGLAVFALAVLTTVRLFAPPAAGASTPEPAQQPTGTTSETLDGDAIITTDTEGRVDFMNAAAQGITGWHPDQARHRPISEVLTLLDERSRTPVPSAPGPVRDCAVPIHPVGTRILVGRTGTERLVEESAVPIGEGGGEAQGAVYVIRDLTGRSPERAPQGEPERIARITIDALSANVCVLDAKGTIVAVNRSWRHFARDNGLAVPDAGLGANYLSVCDAAAFEGDTDAANFVSGLRAVMRGERDSYSFEYACHSPREQRWFMARATRFAGNAPAGAVVAHEDVSQLKRIQQELKILNDTLEQRVAERTAEVFRSQDALRQAERLAAMGQMVAALSHESRNALQRSHTCLDLLARRTADRPELLQLVAGAQKAHADLQRIHEEVRQYAAPMVLERASHDVAAIWREAWEHLGQARERRVTALVENVRGSTNVAVDRFRVLQVFRNLFENSLAACAEPAQIRITATEDELDGFPALRIAVRDNGPGIDPALADRVFEAFYTTKSHGTGLGMAIVKRIVEAHQGRIDLDPGPGRGLEVALILPRQAPDEGAAPV